MSQGRPQQHHQEQQPHPGLDSCSRPDPFAIPELIYIIGDYLDRQSVAITLRVCETWHQAFAPRIWSNIEVNSRMAAFPDRYSNLVKTIVLPFNNPTSSKFLDSLVCPNLSTLKICGLNCIELQAFEFSILAFIDRHKTTLTHLERIPVVTQEFLVALENCPLLQNLRVRLPDRQGFIRFAE